MIKPPKVKIDQELEKYQHHVLAQLVTKKWEDVEAAEQEVAGFLVFAEKIYQRKKDGSWGETPCMIHPLRNHEKRQARKEARRIAEQEKIDPEKDADLFSELDTLCILHLAIRNTTPPYEPLYGSPEEMERALDRDVLSHMIGVIDSYSDLLDPRPDQLDSNQVLALIAAISEGRSIRPLHAYGGAAQVSFIVTMADLLLGLQTGKLLPESFAVSMPAR